MPAWLCVHFDWWLWSQSDIDCGLVDCMEWEWWCLWPACQLDWFYGVRVMVFVVWLTDCMEWEWWCLWPGWLTDHYGVRLIVFVAWLTDYGVFVAWLTVECGVCGLVEWSEWWCLWPGWLTMECLWPCWLTMECLWPSWLTVWSESGGVCGLLDWLWSVCGRVD